MNGRDNLAPPPAACTLSTSSSGPSMRKVSPKVSPPCSKRLRSDLLNKLGIVDDRSPRLPNVSSCKTPQKTVLGPIRIVKAPLKRDEGPVLRVQIPSPSLLVALGSIFRVGSPSSASTASTMDADDASTLSSSSSSERRRGLTFDEEVSVVHIPRREQYSNRIQQHLWNSAEVLQANAMRNTIEYAADGWNWEQVREEHEHIHCRELGEFIHPVHQEIARMIRHEQGLPEDTPVWTPFLKDAPIGTCGDPLGE